MTVTQRAAYTPPPGLRLPVPGDGHDYKPQFADAILTENHPAIYELHEQVLKLSIQGEQRIRGLNPHNHTHVVGYIGSISPDDWRVARGKKIPTGSKFAPWRSRPMERRDFDALLEHDDWCISMTWPRGTWVRWATIRDGQDWDAYRMLAMEIVPARDLAGLKAARPSSEFNPYQVYNDLQMGWIREAAWDVFGRFYDGGQLLNFIANRLWGLDRSVWVRMLDMGRSNRVCSSAWGYCMEFARVRSKGVTGRWPWPRPFRERNGKIVHLEAYMPDDWSNSSAHVHVGHGGWPPSHLGRTSPESLARHIEGAIGDDEIVAVNRPLNLADPAALAARSVEEVEMARRKEATRTLQALMASGWLTRPERQRARIAISGGASTEYLIELALGYHKSVVRLSRSQSR